MLPTGPSRPWASLSPVTRLVESACEPHQQSPDHGIHLQLAELINNKKANTPREAAMETVRMVNNRNPHVAMLALYLLDTLVKQCGYPFHLQIATKEFLNELVRRFPERPPMMMGPVMTKTLDLIHEWKNTICVTSKHKEDLVHIRDMHRLLSYKGYRFKSFDATRALASANPTENLKSPEELEEEDREAKSAKLQELIRRGTPKDLALAQELMKDLSGAVPEKAPDYAKQTKAELEKVQQKAILLNDMLNNVNDGEKVGLDGDAYQQVADVCKMARPKIQKWINEASEENMDLMDRLLLINDLLNNVIDRYEACKNGDFARANEIHGTINPESKKPDLISFDAFADDEHLGGVSLGADTGSSTPVPAAVSAPGGLPLDLFGSFTSAPTAGGATTSNSTGKQKQDPMSFFNTAPIQPQPQQSPNLFAPTPPPHHQYHQQQQGTSNNLFAQPSRPSQSSSPQPFGGLNFGASPSQSANGAVAAPATTASAKAKDPFADLDSW